MNNITYKNGQLFIENISFNQLAKKYGTPLYIYSKKSLIESYKNITNSLMGLDYLICYSVKTCSNINIIKTLKKEGCGCDIVSGGELFRALAADVSPEKIVYAGVGKSADEIEYALKSNIFMFNCESIQEIELISSVAQKIKKNAKIAIRVNPDVDAHTHSKITTGKKENKFGIDIEIAADIYKKISKMKNLEGYGIHCHIGSQITEVEPFGMALEKVLKVIDKLAGNGIILKTINLGGGLGINYYPEKKPIDLKKYGNLIKSKLKGRNLKLILEPGRFIAGNSGTLLAKVLYTKETSVKKFLITDAAMNDLIRPSLYEAYHHILPAKKSSKTAVYDIVGPVCESGDFLAKDRKIGVVNSGEYIAVLSSGAYGFSMASNYNSRPRSAEILVDGNKSTVIRKREGYADLIDKEI